MKEFVKLKKGGLYSGKLIFTSREEYILVLNINGIYFNFLFLTGDLKGKIFPASVKGPFHDQMKELE